MKLGTVRLKIIGLRTTGGMYGKGAPLIATDDKGNQYRMSAQELLSFIDFPIDYDVEQMRVNKHLTVNKEWLRANRI